MSTLQHLEQMRPRVAIKAYGGIYIYRVLGILLLQGHLKIP